MLFSFILSQAPRRKLLFKTLFPDLALPPQPVITRWGTWIKAAVYFAENFENIATFLNQLDPTEASCIKNAQIAAGNIRIKLDLAFIKANFSCIPDAILKLEAKGLHVAEAIAIFKSVRLHLEKIQRKDFLNKYVQVLNKNEGLTVLSQISCIIENGADALQNKNEFIESLHPDIISALKYAPVTSCDVERSFSVYKRILEDNRRSFLFENLLKHLIIHCNSNRFD